MSRVYKQIVNFILYFIADSSQCVLQQSSRLFSGDFKTFATKDNRNIRLNDIVKWNVFARYQAHQSKIIVFRTGLLSIMDCRIWNTPER